MHATMPISLSERTTLATYTSEFCTNTDWRSLECCVGADFSLVFVDVDGASQGMVVSEVSDPYKSTVTDHTNRPAETGFTRHYIRPKNLFRFVRNLLLILALITSRNRLCRVKHGHRLKPKELLYYSYKSPSYHT